MLYLEKSGNPGASLFLTDKNTWKQLEGGTPLAAHSYKIGLCKHSVVSRGLS
jgi:hypothetical protein